MEISLGKLKELCFGDTLVDYRHLTKVNVHKKIPLRDVSSVQSNLNKVIFHCTDASHWSPDRLSEFFVSERDFPICAYHYYVTHKEVFQMVGENVITYHAAPFNTSSIAFSIDYNATRNEKLDMAFPEDLYSNAVNTATYLLMKYKINPNSLLGHRELPFTGFFMRNDTKVLRKTCPGMKIDLNLFRFNVIKQIQTYLGVIYAKNIAVDGFFGAITTEHVNELEISQ